MSDRGYAPPVDARMQQRAGSGMAAVEKGGCCLICGGPRGGCPSQTQAFDVENLGCAHCAAEMEEQLAKLPEVDDVSLTYTTKQLRITCAHPQEMRLRFQEVCQMVEPDVVISGGEARAVPEERSSEGEEERWAVGTLFAGRRKKGFRALFDLEGQVGDLVCIAAGLVLLVLGLMLEHLPSGVPQGVSIALFLGAYLAVGSEVLLHAARNIRHGRVFDENLLMSVATFGAIAVQQFPEAVGVMLFYRVGELFEERAVERSRNQIMDAVDMRPETVERLIGYQVDLSRPDSEGAAAVEEAHARQTETVAAQTVVVGDFLLIRPGERIPLDGSVIEGASRLDTSPLTGEPVSVSVQAGSAVTSGCINTSGMLVMRVEKLLSESMVTRILDSVENAAASKPRMQRFITQFARVYTPVVIAIAVVTAIVPSLVTGEWARWVYTACTFLVISCPCAIVLSVPLSFFAGIGAAGKMGILFKGGESIEALRKVRAVVMDKTGTITRGDFSVCFVEPAAGFAEDDVLLLAASAEQVSTHPIAVSIVRAARERALAFAEASSVDEEAGRGLRALLACEDGATRTVLCGNREFLECHSVDGLPEANPSRLSGSSVSIAVDGVFAGRIHIADEIKPDSASAIATLRARGLHTVILTGDAEDAACEIAAESGVDEVHARLLPGQKLDELRKIRMREGAVMFVGDGINDAPVLAGADVGGALASGSDAALEAADIVFMNSGLTAIPQSLDIARTVGAIALQNIVFALTVKVVVMAAGFLGMASMWGAVFADVGVAVLCILNSARILYKRY